MFHDYFWLIFFPTLWSFHKFTKWTSHALFTCRVNFLFGRFFRWFLVILGYHRFSQGFYFFIHFHSTFTQGTNKISIHYPIQHTKIWCLYNIKYFFLLQLQQRKWLCRLKYLLLVFFRDLKKTDLFSLLCCDVLARHAKFRLQFFKLFYLFNSFLNRLIWCLFLF